MVPRAGRIGTVPEGPGQELDVHPVGMASGYFASANESLIWGDSETLMYFGLFYLVG